MEAGKRDAGANSTKCLHETKKLYKLMKDAHNLIRERTVKNVRGEVVTFGLRISGATATILTLHQLPGRFYQAIPDVNLYLPPVWPPQDTSTVIDVIGWIMRLKSTTLAASESIIRWTSLPITGGRPEDNGDSMALTTTSPQLLPTSPVMLGDDPISSQ